MADAIPDVSLIDNSEERLPLVLVLDRSGSMDGKAIQELNNGLKVLEQDIKADAIAAKRARIKVISFGGDDAVDIGDWVDAMDFVAPTLTANGRTPTGAAVATALDAIEAQKAELRSAGVSYKRPILMLMSDGLPTDDWESVADVCRAAEQDKKVTVFSIAIGEADKSVLDRFSTRGSARMDGLKFKELFLWLSASVRATSKAVKGEAVQLAATDGWMQPIQTA
jgi:uncharacterized protein YegL